MWADRAVWGAAIQLSEPGVGLSAVPRLTGIDRALSVGMAPPIEKALERHLRRRLTTGRSTVPRAAVVVWADAEGKAMAEDKAQPGKAFGRHPRGKSAFKPRDR